MSKQFQSAEGFFSRNGSFSENDFYDSDLCRSLRSDGANVFRYLAEEGRWNVLNGTKLTRHLLGFFPPDLRGKIPVPALERIGKKLTVDPARIVDFDLCSQKGRFLINARNGVIRIKSASLEKHNSEYYFTYCCSFNYIENADIRQAKAFCEFCRTSLDGSESAMTRLMQMIGYVISSLEGAEKFFIFCGPSDCGKSVVLNLIEHIIGSEHIQAFPLSTITAKQNPAELRYARANINRELTSAKISHPDILKSIVSNEKVTAERKFCQPENFNVHTKLCFAGNALPQLGESDEANIALLNRMCILRFPHSIKNEDKHLDLLDKLLVESDIIASTAVNTLKTLIESNYKFQTDPVSDDYMSVYAEHSKVLEHFIADRFVFGADKSVHTSAVISEYANYCRENGFDKTSTNREVSNYIAALQSVCRDKFRLNGSAPLCGFRGIGFKSVSPLPSQLRI